MAEFQERRRAELTAGAPPATGLLDRDERGRIVLKPPSRTLADTFAQRSGPKG